MKLDNGVLKIQVAHVSILEETVQHVHRLPAATVSRCNRAWQPE